MITVIFIAYLSMFVHRVLADSLFAWLALILMWLFAAVYGVPHCHSMV